MDKLTFEEYVCLTELLIEELDVGEDKTVVRSIMKKLGIDFEEKSDG